MLTREEQIKRLQLARMPRGKKPVQPIAKVSTKKKAQLAEAKAAGTDGEMDLFFKSMRKQMTGRCLFCGGKTQKPDDETFHFSLAHLLPKSVFKSVSINADNIIELCFYGDSCHTNFDNGKITWEFIKDSAEWGFIKEKLLNVLPLVAQEERKVKIYSKLEELVYKK